MKNFDIISCTAVVALSAGLNLVDSNAPYLTLMRLPLGLAGVLFIPGYLLLTALPLRGELGSKLGAAVACGLSLALVPFLALLLDFAGWGLHPAAIAISLLALTLPLAGMALAQRRRTNGAASPSPHERWRLLPTGGKLTTLLLTLLVLLGAAASYAVTHAAPPAYTEFYILGAGGLAEDYPRQVQANGTLTVTLGVINEEGAATTYRVEMRDGAQMVAEAQVSLLLDRQTWQQPVALTLPSAQGEQQVEILLYKAGGAIPYRHLRLIVNRAAGMWEGG